MRLANARLKLDRGREHVEAANECVDTWLGTDAYTIDRQVDPQTGYTVARAKIQAPPPPELGLLIGDAVQNLRSALDHAVYALAESQLGPLPPEIEEALMFPIVGNINRRGEPAEGKKIYASLVSPREGRLGRLHGVPEPACDFIKHEQPYHWNEAWRGHPLWVLHDLNRIDKVTFSRADGPVADGDPLVTYSGADQGVNSHFTREVALQEPTSPIKGSVESILAAVQRQAEWVVAVLERFA